MVKVSPKQLHGGRPSPCDVHGALAETGWWCREGEPNTEAPCPLAGRAVQVSGTSPPSPRFEDCQTGCFNSNDFLFLIHWAERRYVFIQISNWTERRSGELENISTHSSISLFLGWRVRWARELVSWGVQWWEDWSIQFLAFWLIWLNWPGTSGRCLTPPAHSVQIQQVDCRINKNNRLWFLLGFSRMFGHLGQYWNPSHPQTTKVPVKLYAVLNFHAVSQEVVLKRCAKVQRVSNKKHCKSLRVIPPSEKTELKLESQV